MAYGLRPIYGRNNLKWYRTPHPRLVGVWLNAFPNANRLSIPYTLRFTGPQLVTRPVNITSITAALQTSIANTTVLTRLATESLTARNQADIESIVKAQLMPGQVQIEVEFDPADPLDLLAISAISAKCLFNASPASRNVTVDTTLAADRILGSWLVSCGYPDAANPNQPLVLQRRRSLHQSAFSQLQTNLLNGNGWCNMGAADYTGIDEPLYDGINRLPQMAGVPPNCAPLDFVNMGATHNPPIVTAIRGALTELANENGKCGNPIMRWFNLIINNYIQYVASLNRYILSYGECGFRLSDRRVQEMMMDNNQGAGLNGSFNEPLVIAIRSDSLYKYMRALPEKFTPPTALPQQINAESLVSAELQRVISAYAERFHI